jgi:hypothetical protein
VCAIARRAHRHTGGSRRVADGRTPRRAADRWTPRRALCYGNIWSHYAIGRGGGSEGAPSWRQGRHTAREQWGAARYGATHVETNVCRYAPSISTALLCAHLQVHMPAHAHVRYGTRISCVYHGHRAHSAYELSGPAWRGFVTGQHVPL